MKCRNINSVLQMKIRRYIEYTFNNEKNGFQRGSTMFQELNPHLQKEINLDIYSKKISEIKIFSKTFSSKFLNSLSLIVKEKHLSPDEVLFQVNSYHYCSFLIRFFSIIRIIMNLISIMLVRVALKCFITLKVKIKFLIKYAELIIIFLEILVNLF